MWEEREREGGGVTKCVKRAIQHSTGGGTSLDNDVLRENPQCVLVC